MVGVGDEHGEAGDRRRHAVRRAEPLAHVLDHLALRVERLQPDAEREHRRAPVRRDRGLREVGRDGVQQRADLLARRRQRGRAEQVRQRQRRAQLAARAPLLRVVPVPRQQLLLVRAHPRDHLRVGQILGLDEHVDLARDARVALQRVEVAHRGEVLRDEPRKVGDDRDPRVQRPPADRERAGDDEHAPGVAREQPAMVRSSCGARTRRVVPSKRSPAPRNARATGPPEARRRAASVSTAVPAVRATASDTPTPTTSSAPKPRTIGTGESSRTRKPTAVASAAVAIAPTARRSRLVLDAVVDRQAHQHRQDRDRGHRQRQARAAASAPKTIATAHSASPSGSSRSRARNSTREHERHHRHRDQQQPQRRGRQHVGQVAGEHRHAGDDVAAAAVEAPVGHRHGRPDRRHRPRPLRLAQPGLQPHRDQRRVRRREQVREARLRLPRTARGVEDQRVDEVRVVELRRAGQVQPVLGVQRQQLLRELRVDELLGLLAQPRRLGLRAPVGQRQLARRLRSRARPAPPARASAPAAAW